MNPAITFIAEPLSMCTEILSRSSGMFVTVCKPRRNLWIFHADGLLWSRRRWIGSKGGGIQSRRKRLPIPWRRHHVRRGIITKWKIHLGKSLRLGKRCHILTKLTRMLRAWTIFIEIDFERLFIH